MTQSAISHQLRVLKQMKLVKNRREGKTVFYSLADGHIQSIISQGMEHSKFKKKHNKSALNISAHAKSTCCRQYYHQVIRYRVRFI